jgi:hypothetical protein
VKTTQTRPEFKWWDALLVSFGALVIVGAWLGGLVIHVVNVLLMACIPVAIAARVWAGVKETRGSCLPMDVLDSPSMRRCPVPS